MEKRNIRLDIMYEGTKYQGWQRLGNTDNTIQGKIENVLSKMTEETIQIIGSGRTDAGVHAYQQVANFNTYSQKPLDEMKTYLNEYLPQDISITEIKEASERFHSRYNVMEKTYLYRIWREDYPPIFERPFVYWLNTPLNLDRIKEATSKLIGEHDFQGFTNKKTKKSTVRNIKDIKIETTPNEIRFYLIADGFLYNMARIIVGTLIEIGREKRTINSIDHIFDSQVRSQAGEKVPAQGLTLHSVRYH
jgi:tRNA pseudouridine38-40 synthase